MAPTPPTNEPPAANEGATTSYFKFDTRLDYYMQLAEGPSLPDDDSETHEYPGETLDEVGNPQDLVMVDSDHPNVLHPLVPTPAAGDGRERCSVSSDAVRLPAPSPIYLSPATRTGAFHAMQDGRRSYFGPASYLHLLNPPSTLWDPLGNRNNRSELGNNRFLMPVEKRAIEDELVDCFFTWDNLFLDCFDNGLYQRDKCRYESGQDALLYSPALGYAILAVGSLYSSEASSPTEPTPSEDFASRARDFLNAELDKPSVSTILALIVLCSLSAADALDDQGWYYSGTALRLISGLGLDQENALSHPLESGTTLQALQRCIVKGAFCVDTIWRSWCGRLSDLTCPSLPDMDIENFYGSTTQDPKCAAVSRFTSLELIHRDMLWRLTKPGESLEPVQQALDEWKSSCREPHSEEDNGASALDIQSLMHYHGICIQLNRVWTRADMPQHSPRAIQLPGSFSKCIEAATEISRLQHLFRQRHGLRKLQPLSTHPMLAGSLVTVQQLADSMAISKESKQARQNFLRSIQAFGEMGETMTIGSRALVIVMTAQREWQGGSL